MSAFDARAPRTSSSLAGCSSRRVQGPSRYLAAWRPTWYGRGVQIRDIELTNFRGFEALKCELHPECTLFVGINGSGKTSVLDGIAALLAIWTMATQNRGHDGKLLADDRRLIRRVVNGVPSPRSRARPAFAARSRGRARGCTGRP
nr:AAA family ATPase [Nannocystis pusilla]